MGWLLRVVFGCAVFTTMAYVALLCFVVVVSFVRLDFAELRHAAEEMSWLGFRWVVVISMFLSILVFSEE